MKKTNKTKPDAAAEKEIKQSQESETVNNGATSETWMILLLHWTRWKDPIRLMTSCWDDPITDVAVDPSEIADDINIICSDDHETEVDAVRTSERRLTLPTMWHT